LVLYGLLGVFFFLWPMASRGAGYSKSELACLGFLGLIFVQALMSDSPLRAFMVFYRYYFLYLLFFEMRFNQGQESWRFLGAVCLASALFMGLGGIYQVFIDSSPMPLSWGGYLADGSVLKRSFGLFDNPNLFGSFLMMACVLGLAQWFKEGQKGSALLFLFLFFSLILTQSRGASLGFLVVLFILLPTLSSRRRWICIFFGLVLLGATWFLGRIPASSKLDLGINQRVELYKGVVRLVQARGFLGTGPGSFYSIYPYYRTLGGYYPLHAHNHFLEIISDSGLAGGVLCLAFFGFLIWSRLQKASANIWLLAFLAGCIVNSMSNQSFSLFSIVWMAVISAVILDQSSPDSCRTGKLWNGMHLGLLLCLAFFLFAEFQKYKLYRSPIDSQRLEQTYPFYLRSDPAFAANQMTRILKAGSKQDLQEARDWCLSFVNSLPYEAEFPFLLGKIYQSLGEESLAHPMFRLALSRDPYSERYAVALMELYLRRGDLEKLESLGMRALESNPAYRPINSWYDSIQVLMLKAYHRHGKSKKLLEFGKKLIWVNSDLGKIQEELYGIRN
jgi:tetratricopeptide (TPR) repeat protein